MSESRDAGQMPMDGHVHLDEATLLEAALDPTASALREQVLGCAACAAALGELQAFADALRAAASEPTQPEQAAAERIGEKVLALTTREDLSPRGDLRLVVRFAIERVRASGALRVAAALVIAHLCALPVLAWIVLRAPRRSGEFQARIEAPVEPYFASERDSEPERVPSVALPEGEPRTLEVDPPSGESEWLAGVRRADRAAWSTLAPEPWSPAAPQESLAQLLWIRAAVLAGRSAPEWVFERMPDGSPSRMATWTEILLDEWARSGARPAHLDATLARLAALPDFQRSRVVTCALQRAASFGALEGEELARFARGSSSAREVLTRAAREPLSGLLRESLGDLRDPSNVEREAALDAWGSPRR
jgi:hypothetical protein